MRIVITGGTGQVGRDLADALSGRCPPGGIATSLLGAAPIAPGDHEVHALSHDALDVCDPDALSSRFESIAPEVVVHLAAYTAVDRAEHDRDRAFAVNEGGTKLVSSAAAGAGAHLIYVSTDYVFDGTQGRPLVESDVTGPLNVYGASKLAGEQSCDPSSTVLRTAWVMGSRARTVASLGIEAARDGRTLRFVDDQVGSPTASADLAAAICRFVLAPEPGVFHVAGHGSASWYEVLRFIVASAGGSAEQVLPIPTAALDPAPAAQRPAYSALRSERLGLETLPEWQDGIGRLVRVLLDEGSR